MADARRQNRERVDRVRNIKCVHCGQPIDTASYRTYIKDGSISFAHFDCHIKEEQRLSGNPPF